MADRATVPALPSGGLRAGAWYFQLGGSGTRGGPDPKGAGCACIEGNAGTA